MSLINKLSDWPPNYHKTPTIDVLVSGYGEVNFEPSNIYKQVHTKAVNTVCLGLCHCQSVSSVSHFFLEFRV